MIPSEIKHIIVHCSATREGDDSINAEVNEKEPIQIGVPFTKDFEKGQVLETIGTAVKEQTKELFGKK